MFSALGLFKDIRCPRESECKLTNCLFDHRALNENYKNESTAQADEYNPLSAGEIAQPPLKRRRLDSENAALKQNQPQAAKAAPGNSLDQSNTKIASVITKPSVSPDKKSSTSSSVASHVSTATVRTISQSKPASIKRSISPPNRKTKQPLNSRPPEKLAPRQVAKAPVPFKSRLSYIELLHKLVKEHNANIAKGPSSDKHLILDNSELIQLVLDDEERAASATSADVYKNTMSQCYLRYKKISIPDWKALVLEQFRSTDKETAGSADVLLSSGLAVAEEMELLRGLKTAVSGLETYGYVTVPPTAAQIQKAKEAVAAAQGFEVCDRCGTRFQVFPGRNTEGKLTTQGACYYHWARIPRTQTAKNARMFGQADTFYPCCNQPPGSEGCTTADAHVFKVSDPKRLASLLQFEKTPERTQQRRQPVAFDCEMAYTTYGMELVRLTAISWPEKKELLDVLVRPYGEILDLNTRFSGVSQEQFANVMAYDMASNPGDLAGATKKMQSLRKVESPAFARKLLFDLITPESPLIGHAIENDLNACRIIHPFIIDTVLLYAHPAGLPARYGLKVLASKYLNRGIQMAGAEGHDSKEDSIATGDLVRLKVADKWKTMKAQGWKFESEHLVAPTKS